MDWNVYFMQGIELLFLGIGSYFDLKNRELPVKLFVVFGILGIFANGILEYQSVKGMFAGIVPGILFLGLAKVTKEKIGYGDGIGFCVLGIYEGIRGVFAVLFPAFCLCACYGLWKMLVFKQGLGDTMPLFPFLFLALVGVIVW